MRCECVSATCTKDKGTCNTRLGETLQRAAVMLVELLANMKQKNSCAQEPKQC